MVRSLMAATALMGSLVGSLAFAGGALAAQGGPFVGETVFGDSLSDGGNISILEGSPTLMRFTTNPGLTTVEDVAAFYGLALTPSLAGGTDFAFGGAGVNTNSPGTPAGVPTLTTQITGYLAANPTANPRELYSVFGGANDIFYNATQVAVGAYVAANSAGLTPAQVAYLTAAASAAQGVSGPESATQAYTNVAGAAAQEIALIGQLQKAGARYILVFNLPDIGRTPEAQAENAASPGAAAGLTTLTNGFNTTLNAGLANAKLGIIPVNTYALLNEVLANPSLYGYSNSTVPDCTVPSSIECTPSTLRGPPSSFVFADGVHPTSYTHSLFAQVVESEIMAPQQVSLLAEQPLATLEAERNSVDQELLDLQQAPAPGVRLFATGGYVNQRIGAQASTPSLHDDDGLITAGVDVGLAPGVTLGGELSGGGSTADLNGQLRRFHTDAVVGSIFGQYVLGQAYVTGQAGYGSLNVNDILRSFNIGPAVRAESGSTSGQTSTLAIAGGYWFGAPTLRAGPFVGATYERVHIDAYGEKGGDSTSMTFGGQTRESMIGEAGVRVQGALPTGFATLRPFAEVAYAYDNDAHSRDVVAGLTTMPGEFAVPGFSPDKSWGVAQVGVSADLGPHWRAFAAYDGRFSGRNTDYNGGQVGLKYDF